jgi:hypothetical protein
VTPRRRGKLIDLERQQMVRNQIAHALEPEARELREHLALVRNA